MALPKFSAGQRVSVSRSLRVASPAGFFSIVRPLPEAQNGRVQYRVKSETEAFERIVDEANLQPAEVSAELS